MPRPSLYNLDCDTDDGGARITAAKIAVGSHSFIWEIDGPLRSLNHPMQELWAAVSLGNPLACGCAEFLSTWKSEPPKPAKPPTLQDRLLVRLRHPLRNLPQPMLLNGRLTFAESWGSFSLPVPSSYIRLALEGRHVSKSPEALILSITPQKRGLPIADCLIWRTYRKGIERARYRVKSTLPNQPVVLGSRLP